MKSLIIKLKCIVVFFVLSVSIIYSQKETSIDTSITQTLKGSAAISGDALFYIHVGESYVVFISGNAGYFVANNLLLGASVTHYLSGTSNDMEKEFGYGPMLEYYFGNSASKPFIGLVLQATTAAHVPGKYFYQVRVGYHISIAKYFGLQPILQWIGNKKSLSIIPMFGIGVKGFIF